jgi:hypothetical protein
VSPLLCAVCYSAKDDAANAAFLVMTAFMTLLPLAVLGGLIYWVVRRIRAAEAVEAAELERHADGERGEAASLPSS